jgi:heavy metal sensor kinase
VDAPFHERVRRITIMARFTRVFGVPKLPVAKMRGLRFRLTVSYVVFFAVLLIVIGLVYRQNLKSQLDGVERAALESDWDAAKGYIKIVNYQPEWDAVDEDDPEGQLIEDRLKQVYFVADGKGNSLGESDTYTSLGDSRYSLPEIRRILSAGKSEVSERISGESIPYMVEAGVLPGNKERYFLVVCRSLKDARHTVHVYTLQYFLALPLMIAVCATLGWLIAGRAIRPVNLVAQAAQNITGSNLSLNIPLRGAGDELDHLVDSFNRMTARLHQSFEQIRQFSTDVSHELRTPLTAIRGQLEVGLFTAETPEQYREAMVNALEDVEKLSSIVRALLLLSQSESGQLTLQKVPLDLAALTLDVVDQFQIPAEEKHVTLTPTFHPGAIISADRTQIERLLSNLLSNAIKYTPANGTVRVMAGPADTSGWARLVIEDTGVGIPAENLPHIFDRFYRVRNAQTNVVPGLGLGLSFVAWIVEVHGGRIEVASTPGEGSRFTVLLPLAATRAEPETAEVASFEPSALDSQLHG